MLLKVRASLFLLTCKENDVFQNQKGENILVRWIEHDFALDSLHFLFFNLLSVQLKGTHPSQWKLLCLWVIQSLVFSPTSSLKNWAWSLKNDPVRKTPNHVSTCYPVPKDTMGVTLQSMMLLKVRTSLILVTWKGSDLWDHIHNQKSQNTLGQIIMHLKISTCVNFFTLILFNIIY